MPTYEYVCPNGHEFTLFQKVTAKPRTKCTACGETAQRKISAGAGLHFKGSGFYITDYGKDGKGPRKPATTGEGSSAESGAKSESKAESSSPKPAAAKN
ncbi:MAG: FmdB family zinc ribbon protein [Gemmatimonadota bacterium]